MYTYGSLARSVAKRRFINSRQAQDHHVIPYEFRTHPLISRLHYDVNSSDNLILMPTYYGMLTLRTRRDRIIHDGGHPAYNKYVGKMLDCIHTKDELDLFVQFLKRSLRYNSDIIPWY
jgi:hypothetical protein